jgi:hypothetical protein
MQRLPLRSLYQIRLFEGRLKISSDQRGGQSHMQIAVYSDNIAGHVWLILCHLRGSPDTTQATALCAVVVRQGSDWVDKYVTPSLDVSYDVWHTARIEADPEMASFRLYIDGTLLGAHTANAAAALKAASNLHPWIEV